MQCAFEMTQHPLLIRAGAARRTIANLGQLANWRETKPISASSLRRTDIGRWQMHGTTLADAARLRGARVAFVIQQTLSGVLRNGTLLLMVMAGAGLAARPSVGQGEETCSGLTTLLNQQPIAQHTGLTSSVTSQTRAAENFAFAAEAVVSRIVFWGFYGDADEPEVFTINFRGDDAGNPSFVDIGPVFDGVVPIRTELQSGIFRFVADVGPLALSSGIHWIEIFASGFAPGVSRAGTRTRLVPRGPPSPNDQFFTWHFGTLDPQHGLPGLAFGSSGLSADPEAGDLALQLCGPSAPTQAYAVPALQPRGALVLVALVAAAGVALAIRSRFSE